MEFRIADTFTGSLARRKCRTPGAEGGDLNPQSGEDESDARKRPRILVLQGLATLSGARRRHLKRPYKPRIAPPKRHRSSFDLIE